LPYIEPMTLNTTLNFGQFSIDETKSLEELGKLTYSSTATPLHPDLEKEVSYGPLTFETVIRNFKAMNHGAVFTISDNQEGAYENLSDVEKENTMTLFNSIKGQPWLGEVHKHNERYMAGKQHGNEPHPFLDIQHIQSRKVVDLRPIKKIKDSQIDFSTLNEDLDLSKIRYGSSYNEKYSLDGLPIFSECFLSARPDGTINGVFGVDYIKLFRVHGLIPTLLDRLADVTKNALLSFDDMLMFFVETEMKKSLRMKIVRHGGSKKKLIYDSADVNQKGIYPKKTEYFNVDGGVKISSSNPLGYLNPVPLASNVGFLGADFPDISMLEFYTFSDLDERKRPDTEYSYEVQLEIEDPLFKILSNALNLIIEALEGQGTRMGLNQLVELVTAQPKNKNILNEAGSPYIEGIMADLLTPEDSTQTVNNNNFVPQKTILQIIEEYDRRFEQQSVNTEGVLISIESLLSANIIPILLNSQKEGTVIDSSFIDSIASAISVKDDESISLNNLAYIQDALQSLRMDLANVIDGLSNVNHSKGGDSNSATLNTTVAPGNTNSSLRRVTAKKHFPYKIKKTNYGFDYLRIFPEQNTGPAESSLKSISAETFMSRMNFVFAKYFNPNSEEGKMALNTSYTYLPLYTSGVVLPERLRSKSVDSNDWSALLQSMMLFKAEKLSSMSEKNIFSYTQQTQTNSKYFNRSLGLGKKESASMFKTQKSKINELIKAERNQALVADFGLNIQDKIGVGEAVETINNKVTNQKMEVKTKKESSSTNIKTNYFLSYVNNFTEGNFNSNDLLPVQYGDWEAADAAGESLPQHVLSLLYHNLVAGGEQNNILGKPTTNYDFPTFYNSLFDSSAPAGQLYASRLAEYFFTFLNFVKIDYLIDFEKFFMSSSTSEGPPVKTIVDVDNMAINSAIWAPLTRTQIIQLASDQSLFCRITNHKMSFLSDHGLRKDLAFYPNFNKYFIINNNEAGATTVLNDFGSQIISSGFVTG